jgi:2-keto-4-pentenoate hydratase/2-oxohepta-3-ene-1,7-dioic acid hydratase in catechol pathway
VRWSSYRTSDGPVRLGLEQNGALYGSRQHTRLLDLLGDDGTALQQAAAQALADPLEVLPIDRVQVTAPVPVPPSIRDFMAFEDHLKPILAARGATIDPAWYEVPAFYFTNPAAILGPTDTVPAAPGGTELDFELEVAAVLGRPGRDLTPPHAESLIAGYVLLCDWSARDLQRRERGIGLGPVKGKDWATTLGPYFVTADELARAPASTAPDLRLTAAVNGRLYSDGNLDQLYWSFGEMIAYASRGTEVRAGDVIGSGTVGTGCIADLAARHGADAYPWLRPGDEISLDGGILGRITTRMTDPAAVVPLRR